MHARPDPGKCGSGDCSTSRPGEAKLDMLELTPNDDDGLSSVFCALWNGLRRSTLSLHSISQHDMPTAYSCDPSMRSNSSRRMRGRSPQLSSRSSTAAPLRTLCAPPRGYESDTESSKSVYDFPVPCWPNAMSVALNPCRRRGRMASSRTAAGDVSAPRHPRNRRIEYATIATHFPKAVQNSPSRRAVHLTLARPSRQRLRHPVLSHGVLKGRCARRPRIPHRNGVRPRAGAVAAAAQSLDLLVVIPSGLGDLALAADPAYDVRLRHLGIATAERLQLVA